MTRPTKRHLRAEVATAHVEVGQPACGVGPRFNATADRALVTCEHGACGGVRRAPENDGSQLALALEARTELGRVEVAVPAPKAPAVLSPSAVRTLAFAAERYCLADAENSVLAGIVSRVRDAIDEAQAWLRESNGEVER